MKKQSGIIIYSPTDLIRYLASPFASWLDRYHLENPGAIRPDEQTEEEKLLSRTGDEHEQSILTSYKASGSGVLEIRRSDFAAAHAATLAAIKDKTPIIYQAALQDGVFAGYADFLEPRRQENLKFGIRSWHSRQSLITRFNSAATPKCWLPPRGRRCRSGSGSFWGTVIASSSGSRISSIITVT